MNNVMMTLGEFQFSITTAAYQELTRTREWRWPTQERFMQNQALQFVGPGGDTISLPGVIYPEYRGGLGQVEAMAALADKGMPLDMISGTGVVLGRWVIERLEEKHSTFAVQGVGRKQEFTLGLRKFAPPSAGAGAAFSAPAAAVPTSTATPAASAQSLMGSAGSTVSGIASGIGSSLDTLKKIGTAASSVLQPLTRALNTATSLKASIADAKRLLGSAPTSLSTASSLTQLIGAANNAVANSGQAGAAMKLSLDSLTALGSTAPATIQAMQSAMISVNKLTVASTSLQTSASSILGGIGS